MNTKPAKSTKNKKNIYLIKEELIINILLGQRELRKGVKKTYVNQKEVTLAIKIQWRITKEEISDALSSCVGQSNK